MPPTQPQVVIHGIGDLGIQIVNRLMKLQKQLSKCVDVYSSSGKNFKGNLILGTCTLHNTTKGPTSKAIKHLILDDNLPSQKLKSLMKKLNVIYNGAKKRGKYPWVPEKIPRIDLIFCNLSDPVVKTWINLLPSIPRSKTIKRVLLFQVPHQLPRTNIKRKLGRTLNQLKQYMDALLEYPTFFATFSRSAAEHELPRKASTPAIHIITQILHLLSTSGPINISFQDLINLFSGSHRGIVLSIKSRGKTLIANLQKALKYPYLTQLNKIKKTLISLSGKDYTLKNVIDLLESCHQKFHRKSQIQWGVSELDPTQSSFTTGQLILLGTT